MRIGEYLKLISSQHRQRERYTATVEALLKQPCAQEDLLHALRTAFDLDTAVGEQLDATGVRIGRSRHVSLPLENYFSWNIEGLGWNEAPWRGKYDPESYMHRMPDALYRQLLYAKVAANHWDGTVPGAYAAWEIAFGTENSIILIQDNQDMSMIVGVSGKNLETLFEQLLLQGYVPLKPEGVRIAWFALPPAGWMDESGDGKGRLFAWDCDSEALGGFNEAAWPRKLVPLNMDYYRGA